MKVKPINVKSRTYIASSKKIMIKILNLKSVILLEFQNIKIVFHKSLFQVDLKKFLLLQKSKALCGGYILLVIIKSKKYLKRFTKNKFKKQIKKKKMKK